MSQINLMFHDVKLNPSRWNTNPNRFEELIQIIVEHQNLNKIVITVDDAGKGNYEYMLPVFEKYGLKAHIFVPTKFISDGKGKSSYMTVQQIKEFSDLGHFVGSHSHTHPINISLLSHAEIENEWSESKSILESITGKSVDSCSIPGGFYSKNQLGILRNLGYKIIFTSIPTYKVFHKGVQELRGRFSIENKINDKDFCKILSEELWIQRKLFLRQKVSQAMHTIQHRIA